MISRARGIDAGVIEAFLGAAVAGLGLLLAAVAFLSWRRADNSKMAVLGVAFLVAALSGAYLLAVEFSGGGGGAMTSSVLAAALFLNLLLLYLALFAKQK